LTETLVSAARNLHVLDTSIREVREFDHEDSWRWHHVVWNKFTWIYFRTHGITSQEADTF